MEKYLELAVIFKIQKFKNDVVNYLPIKTVIGYFNNDVDAFIDNSGKAYKHIITEPDGYGFCYRCNINDISQKYSNLPFFIIKHIVLNEVKKYSYQYILDMNFNEPVILITNKSNSKVSALLDDDIISYYINTNSKFIEEGLGIEVFYDDEDIEHKIEPASKENGCGLNNSNIDVAALYREITSSVIDQDEPIKQILTAIWKHYSNFSGNKSRNILINGNTGVGKTEIFRILSKKINAPCYIAVANQYTASGYIGKNTEDMLIGLLNAADGNLEKAQNGILIIDEIDKLAETSKQETINKRDVQEELLKIIEDGTFTVNYNRKKVTFDTSKLLVIAMGSWSRIELTEKKNIGFEQTAEKRKYTDLTREDFIKNGMIPEFIARFPVIVQMNELTKDSFIKILTQGKNNILALNKDFFARNNIKLTLSSDTITSIANIASNEPYGARSLDEIIERALTVASFEIASNPKDYEELIITPETITDNTKYKLVRRKESN